MKHFLESSSLIQENTHPCSKALKGSSPFSKAPTSIAKKREYNRDSVPRLLKFNWIEFLRARVQAIQILFSSEIWKIEAVHSLHVPKLVNEVCLMALQRGSLCDTPINTSPLDFYFYVQLIYTYILRNSSLCCSSYPSMVGQVSRDASHNCRAPLFALVNNNLLVSTFLRTKCSVAPVHVDILPL